MMTSDDGVFMKMFKQGLPTALRPLLCGAAASVLLASCGGGGGQVDPFRPTRLIALGDESSLLTPEGKKYSVNALATQTDTTLPDVIDCKANPLWVQTVASGFGLVFAQCNPDKVASPAGMMYAQLGAKVADVKAQIDTHLAGSSFGPKDLVTVLVGVNDVLELYRQYPAQSQSALEAIAEQRGLALAEQINRVANANGRALFVLIPDLGLTPFAIAEKAAHADTDRAALLTRLTAKFNGKLRLSVINDGRLIAMVNGAETVQVIAKIPAAYGFVNIDKAACSVALPECTTKTMVSTTDSNGAAITANGTSWMWADALLMGAGLHARLGSTALSAASIHPF
jgi:hypothetical protein